MLFPTDEPNARQAVAGDGPSKPFAALISHLLTYKIRIAAAAILGLALSGLALCFVTPSYQAEAVVVVDSRRNKLADAESALSSIVVDQYQSALKSELDLMTSADLARHVIVSLGLLDTPEYASAKTHVPMARRFEAWRGELVDGAQAMLSVAGLHPVPPPSPPARTAPDSRGAETQATTMESAVETFAAHFWAVNDPKSLTIRIGYRSTSPETAAAVTNAALRRYLAADEELKAAAAERAEAWLHGRIATLRTDLDATERSVEEFRASHDLATIRDKSPLQQELLQLEGQRVYVQTQLAAAQAKVEHDLQQGGLNARAMSSDVLASRTIEGLRQQEATLVAEQLQLGAVRLPSDPSMVKIAAQLSGLRAAIRDEVERIVQSHQSDLHLDENSLANIVVQIGLVQEKINTANAADIKLRSLEADAAAKRAVLNKFTERFDQDAGEPLTPPDARVVSWAAVPVDPSSPRYGLVLAGGMLGFAFLAFCLSLGYERLRPGFDGMQELEEELGLVVAGLTVALSSRARSARRGDGRAAIESPPMRDLAVTVRAFAHLPEDSGASRVVLVTSALAKEGKSTVALSLARSVAGGGQRCLLIDGDIRNPSLHAKLGLPATPGLVEVTIDHAPLASVARPVFGEQFHFLAAGRPTPDTLSPFTIQSFGQAIAALRQSYDVIVIDSAPVLLASEVLVLVGIADVTLLLVKWRTTPRDIARKASNLITRCSAGPCLAVLSQVNLRRMRRTGSRRMEEYYRDAYRFS